MSLPHPDLEPISVKCGVITVSDTRTLQNDRSGAIIRDSLTVEGHVVILYLIVPDEPTQIQSLLNQLGKQDEIEAVIFNGGTGIAPRDTTYDALAPLLEKTISGFGELFRYLSYAEIGSRSMASRAIAGVYKNKLIFSLPGSSNAVALALEKLILPELRHLVGQLKPS
ncbi:MAG: Molybdenum cofactor biosynthesis protein B [Chroococcopsis gigantea SAG 12.99]|jgi:molybdenum cofactor biosynthesis protein B|nr:MogA/MoaB family molybdenum cofactor biosynthesis protein [Chlorogloea purpurea SAG 13.99]MDV3001815.1 Molybdenum cofactor biosynthesis protein B [Chroococcopsis gigantea SAG 12.99]